MIHFYLRYSLQLCFCIVMGLLQPAKIDSEKHRTSLSPLNIIYGCPIERVVCGGLSCELSQSFLDLILLLALLPLSMLPTRRLDSDALLMLYV